METIEKTVFISYRRQNFPWALSIYQDLTHHGFDVFFDYQSIRTGDFEQVIIGNIKRRAHFLVVLTSSALDKCKNPGDWLRREIETAMDEKRNIIPLMIGGFDFGHPDVKKALTGKLETLKSYNGLEVPAAYFFEAMKRLREQYLNVYLSAVLHPLSKAVEQITEQVQEEANLEKVELSELSAQEWFERAYQASERGDTQEAFQLYQKAVELDTEFILAYTNLENKLNDKNQYQKLEQSFRKAIALNLENAGAYYNLGVLLSDMDRYQEAEQVFRKAIDLDPDYTKAYNNLGILLQNTRRLEEAEQVFRKAIDLDPDYTKAYNNLGILLQNTKRLEEAEQAYRKSITLNPAEADYHYNLGGIMHDMGKFEEAEQAYRIAITLNPYSAEAYNNLGVLLEYTKRHKEAEQIYRKAIELDAEDASPYYNLACLMSLQDRAEEGFNWLSQAFQKGYESFSWAWQDNDLNNLRVADLERFTSIVGSKPEG